MYGLQACIESAGDSKAESTLLGKRTPDATPDATPPPPAMRAAALAAAAAGRRCGEVFAGSTAASSGCGEDGTMSLQQVHRKLALPLYLVAWAASDANLSVGGEEVLIPMISATMHAGTDSVSGLEGNLDPEAIYEE